MQGAYAGVLALRRRGLVAAADGFTEAGLRTREQIESMYEAGHRVFLDGRVLAVVPGTPTTIKCGRHMLKIGSTRRARAVDFACGREVIVQ